MKILECKRTKGQHVLPLFYNLDPSEVRNQTNSVGEAFVKHGERFKNDENKVHGWKTVLTEAANLSGKLLGNRNEPEFIHEIIEWVNSILVKKTDLQVARYPVGIESLLQDMKLLLDIENIVSKQMVGIFGTAGVGKTTLAKAIYNSIASQFEGCCFLENIRETSSQTGLIHLQNKLLSKILECSSIIVDNVDQGITLIEQRLCLKRILLVLDDVDHSDQIEKIVGNCDWFDLGSRVIITTRDAHLLTKYQALTYRVRELDHYKALQLFSYHAFNKDSPDDGYVEVTNDVINYAGGLPLALVVLGSALKDTVCFFKGKEVGYVTKILGSCGIKELMDRRLITESNKLLEMHDLLQEMDREIVRQESPKEPGKRSRLWFHEDVRNVLEGNTGTNKVEGILINLPEEEVIRLSPKVFKKMKRLRIFINNNARIFEKPTFLSNELRVLYWPKYPGEFLPSTFCGKNIVILSMPHSHLNELEGVQKLVGAMGGVAFVVALPVVR
ncbi:TMV resistance protein N-like [Corylus avellana]|uniref:TMV resistance protein N-like n=1 Tax=Corylus avellana TaxID=13451 RepID=UPI00286D21AC|nr:TMV resistance protein N-like [Corylus avellana]